MVITSLNKKLLLSFQNTINHFANKLPYLMGENFLSPPLQPIDLRLTLRCNLRCSQCHDWEKKNGFELSTHQWTNLIKQLKAWIPHLYLRFYGGEPLVRSDFFDLLFYCKQIGVKTCLTSNGYAIDQKTADEMIRAQLGQITLSLDGYSEKTHDFLRGKTGAFARVIEAIKLLNKRIPIRINTTLMEHNLEEIGPLMEYCLKKRIQISFAGLFNPLAPSWWEGSWNNYAYLWPIDTKKTSDTLDRIKTFKKQHNSTVSNSFKHLEFLRKYYLDCSSRKTHNSCEILFSRMFIYETGDVYICCFNESIGNILNQLPKEIWHSKKASVVREKMKRCDLKCHCLRGYFQESFFEKAQKFIYDF